MLRMMNKYCSNCLSTQRFLDLDTCLVCERCTKRLIRINVPVIELGRLSEQERLELCRTLDPGPTRIAA
jgi:hypothetical protein